MPTNYIVQQGDCIASIAEQHGLLPDDIWNDPANADLKAQRESMYVLFEGDVVVIRDIDIQLVPCATDARHTFKLLRKPQILQIRLLDRYGMPQAGVDYTLTVDSTSVKGTTNEGGVLQETIAPDAQAGQLIVGVGESIFQLQLGHLNPITEVTGVQTRLQNLGFSADPAITDPDAALKDMLQTFQLANDLDPTGESDEATQQKLVEEHGS